MERRRITARGVVQGVGFRPFVASLAARLGVAGSVRNESGGVVLEIEGPTDTLDAFLRGLVDEAPPLSSIDDLQVDPMPACHETTFRIEASRTEAGCRTSIPPDVATCDACLQELFDPADRRFHYPFLNCTHCGPRFTIIQDLPYDRAMTTMGTFVMCEACQREYENPADRRFHAEPTACPMCGPRLWLEHGGAQVEGPAALEDARTLLRDGRILAVKGLGGFHLACDASLDEALERLRARKGRVDKPFAIMAPTLAAAAELCELDPEDVRLLESRERPIVLLRRRQGAAAAISALVAPGNDHLGVMLPYSPLHHLLVTERPLVMTSGNRSDEPIARDNDEARARLAGMADAFLFHDRPIHAVCDDSVVRVFEGRTLPIRRSRGYAPFPVRLPFEVPPLLAVGGELKATFCLAQGHDAYLSQHIGDMETLETLEAFERAVDHLSRLFRIEPRVVVADRHPGYLSTRWAREWSEGRGVPLEQVQHHHAHLAAVLAEHQAPRATRVVGLVFDGTGYGLDRAIWGGEVFVGGYTDAIRIARLAYVPLPAADTDLRLVHRLALAHLAAAGVAWSDDLPCVRACPETDRRLLARRLAQRVGVVDSSSMGRLFDAVASLLGIRQRASYEAQAAIEMETIATDSTRRYDFDNRAAGELVELDASPVMRAIVADLRRGVPIPEIAGAFHSAVARAGCAMARRARREHGVTTAALSGGVFQNLRLLRETVDGLRSDGFEVLVHQRVPPNDGGLALGQAALVRD